MSSQDVDYFNEIGVNVRKSNKNMISVRDVACLQSLIKHLLCACSIYICIYILHLSCTLNINILYNYVVLLPFSTPVNLLEYFCPEWYFTPYNIVINTNYYWHNTNSMTCSGYANNINNMSCLLSWSLNRDDGMWNSVTDASNNNIFIFHQNDTGCKLKDTLI